MNLLFGLTRAPAPYSADRLADLTAHCGAAQVLPWGQSADLDGWAICDGGSLLGIARADGISLAYTGIFPRSVLGGSGGSPLDDPNATARFLLKRYQEQGPAFLDGLPGQYATVVYDCGRETLLLACDPGGGRKLFVYRNGPRLAFATQLGALKRLLGDEVSIDRTLEDFLLGFEFLPWGRTFFHGVNLLPPGTLLERRGGKITERRIEHPPAVKLAGNLRLEDETGVLNALEETLLEALQDLSPTETRVGVLLEDFPSVMVASLLTRAGKEVETFSLQFPEPGHGQPWAQDLAQRLRVRHHRVAIAPEMIREGLEHFSDRFNQPTSQAHHLIGTAEVCRKMRSVGIRHGFTGEGSDGLFPGSATIGGRIQLLERLSGLPRWTFGLGLAICALPGLEALLGHPYRLGRNLLTILRRRLPARAHITSRTFDELSLSRLRRGEAPDQAASPEAILEDLARGLEDLSPMRLAYRGMDAAGMTRATLEGAADSSGVVLQSPFAHPRVIALAEALPEAFSRPQADNKSPGPIEKLLSRAIPDPAPRPPLRAPIDSWYRGPLRAFLLESYQGLPFDASPAYLRSLLRPKLAEALYRRYFSPGDPSLPGPALLATYASFTKAVGRESSEESA